MTGLSIWLVDKRARGYALRINGVHAATSSFVDRCPVGAAANGVREWFANLPASGINQWHIRYHRTRATPPSDRPRIINGSAPTAAPTSLPPLSGSFQARRPDGTRGVTPQAGHRAPR